jgi:hypothetical protein
MPCDLSPILRPTSSLRLGWGGAGTALRPRSVVAGLVSCRGCFRSSRAHNSDAAGRSRPGSQFGSLTDWEAGGSFDDVIIPLGKPADILRLGSLVTKSPVTIPTDRPWGPQRSPFQQVSVGDSENSVAFQFNSITRGCRRHVAPRHAGSYKLLNTWRLRRFDLGFSSSFLLQYWLLGLACCRRRRFRLQVRPLRCPLRSRCWT